MILMSLKKILVIVAHPDDETIWMGGSILRFMGKWDVNIMSLCRKNDGDRAPKFKKVCDLLGARSFISDLDDEKMNPLENSEIVERIMKFASKKYDYIFSHGGNGEYGHIRHKEVHRAVKEILNKKIIKCKKVFYFSYLKKDESCVYNSNADMLIKLKKPEIDMKKKLVKEVYGFSEDSFEYKSCSEIESFDLK